MRIKIGGVVDGGAVRKKKKFKISTFLRLRQPEPQTSPGREAIPGRKEVLHLRTYNPNAVSTKTDPVPSHEVHNGLERLTRISRVERSLVDIISRHLAGKRLRYFSRRIGGLGRREWANCVGEVVCRRGFFSFFSFFGPPRQVWSRLSVTLSGGACRSVS